MSWPCGSSRSIGSGDTKIRSPIEPRVAEVGLLARQVDAEQPAGELDAAPDAPREHLGDPAEPAVRERLADRAARGVAARVRASSPRSRTRA